MNIISKLKINYGVSYSHIAEISGYSESHISKCARGERNISPKLQFILQNYYDNIKKVSECD